MKKFTIKLSAAGNRQLLMHNVQMADPLNKWTKLIKEITDKGSRRMTEEDHTAKARLEFEAGLYMGLDGAGPVVPSACILACLRGAGTIRRLGEAVLRSLSAIDVESPLEYNGPRTVDAMWKAGMFDTRLVSPAQGSKNKVPRTRPRFEDWSTTADLLIDTEVLGWDKAAWVFEMAGRSIGLLDGRRIGFGRFKYEILAESELDEEVA